jgi:hypothetical protein
MATRMRIAYFAGLAALLVLAPAGCKKSPTSAAPPAGLSAAFNPTSAAADAVVTFVITVTANSQEIRAMGADITFDTAMFQFQDVAKGSLTGSWATIDGNESTPGTVRLGGFVGSGTSVAAGSTGTLAEVHFKVTGGAYGNGQKVDVCLSNFDDDLAQFTSGSACASFTLKK